MKKIRNVCLAMLIQSALLTMLAPVIRAEDATIDGYVTRKEYDELKAQMLVMKKELDALKKEREAGPKQDYTERQSVVERHEVARKDCSGQPNSYSLVGLRGCLRRVTATCPRFRPLSIQSSYGN